MNAEAAKKNRPLTQDIACSLEFKSGPGGRHNGFSRDPAGERSSANRS
jgi:hypothetical protein